MALDVYNTGFPPTWINSYVEDQLLQFDLIAQTELPLPLIPSPWPSSMEDFYNDSLTIRQMEEPIFIAYDRLIRFRPTEFYRNKREQLIYFVYSTSADKLINTIRVITDALDREDAAAQDINSWIRKKQSGTSPLRKNPADPTSDIIPNNVFFHSVRAYQADESRDVIELASVKTLLVNKIIIEYDYHTQTIPGDSTYRYD